MTVSKDDAKARRGFWALLLAGLGILAVGKWTDTLALKDGLLAALVLLACSLAVQCLPRRVRAFALMAAVPVLAQCLQAVSTDIGVFFYFKLLPKLWALALWLLLFCLLWGLLGRPGLAGGVCVTVSVLLALLNLALLQFRGTALQWQDIGSWRAALNVAGGYRLALTGYQKLLAQVAQRYPVVCAQGVRAADGSWLDEKQTAEDDLLNLYRTAVYAHINEPERLENFWAYAAG